LDSTIEKAGIPGFYDGLPGVLVEPPAYHWWIPYLKQRLLSARFTFPPPGALHAQIWSCRAELTLRPKTIDLLLSPEELNFFLRGRCGIRRKVATDMLLWKEPFLAKVLIQYPERH